MAYTENILLPSRGVIYQNANFDGNVAVKPFTTKSYKALLTANASETALKQFIDDCIVDCPIKAKNMNQHDLLAILFKTRAMTLGNMLKTEVRCPDCGKISEIKWDLNTLEIKYLYTDEYPIKVTLPESNKEIGVRFPTGADVIKAKQEADRRAAMFHKNASDYLQVYTLVSILDVDNKDIVDKAEWYESLNPSEAIYIDEVLSQMTDIFGVSMTREEHCPSCDKVFTTVIDIGSDFFRPFTNVKIIAKGKSGNLAGIIEKPDISE